MLPFDVERALAIVIEKEIIFFREQERLKADLVTRFDFSMQGMFREIDDWCYKYVDVKNMKRFLMKTSIYPEESVLKAIVRRSDYDGDARLNFKEFSLAVQPQLEVSKYSQTTAGAVGRSSLRPPTGNTLSKQSTMARNTMKSGLGGT